VKSKSPALLAALLLSVAIPPALCAQSQSVAADTAAEGAQGVQFIVAKDWSLESRDGIQIIAAPEGDARIIIIEGISAANGAEAATKAWKSYDPAFARSGTTTPRAPRDGWEERSYTSYETSPNEKRVVDAYVVRKGDSWTAQLIDASEATLNKRGAAAGLISQSMRPKGYKVESFAGKTAHKLDAAKIDALKAFVSDSMQRLGVPGTAIALIEDGKVIYEGGLGVKKLGSAEPVDAHSRFMIASNTKGMSTLMLATLVDEGKLGWDQLAKDVYPSFRLGSDATTAQVKMRHLVCACTGLPRKDMEWIFNTPRDTKADTVFTHLASTEPTSGFGEMFQYNNLITTAGGYIGGKVAYPKMEVGAAYDKAMEARVFAPLGMKETTFSFAKAIAGDFASPHGMDLDGKPAVAALDMSYSIAPYRPAGGAWSTAHDMAKYAALELSKGLLPNGKRLISQANLLERRKHGVSTGENQWYGMGLFEDRNYGIPVVYHGGSMPGYKSNFFVIPDAKVAAVILTNSDTGNSLLRPFMRRLLELLYDGKPEAAAGVAATAQTIQTSIAEERKKLAVPPDGDAVNGLAVGYSNKELGKLSVQKGTNGSITFRFTDWSSAVASRKNDDGTLSFVTIDPALEGTPFVVATKEGKKALILRDSQHEYWFVED
jgi:CubicO group peptidase (beta-lactamase class C family)